MKGVVKYTKMNALVVGPASRRPLLPPVAGGEVCPGPTKPEPIVMSADQDLYGHIVKRRGGSGMIGSRNDAMDNGVCDRTTWMKAPR